MGLAVCFSGGRCAAKWYASSSATTLTAPEKSLRRSSLHLSGLGQTTRLFEAVQAIGAGFQWGMLPHS